MQNIIELKNVSKTLNGNRILKNINFSLNEGEIVGYIGPNGAGKSTTIKLLCGIYPPDEGYLSVDSNDPFKMRKENAYNIGTVFGQRSQLWPDLPLSDTYKLLAKLYKVSKDDFENRLSYLLKLYEIEHLLNRNVRSFSLGERIKADLIASMLHNPKILFLDEPTIGLDFSSKKKMRRSIIELNKKFNTTIFITSHDVEDIDYLCNRIILLNQGEIIFDGNLDIFKKKYSDFYYLTLKTHELDTSIIELLTSKYNTDIIHRDESIKIRINNVDASKKEILSFITQHDGISDIAIEPPKLDELIENIYRKVKANATI